MEAIVVRLVGSVRLETVNGDNLFPCPSPDTVRLNLENEGIDLSYNSPRPHPVDVGLLAVAGAKCGGEEPNPVSRFVFISKPPVTQASPGNGLAYVLPSPLSGIKDTGPHRLRIFLSFLQGLVRVAEEEV